MNNSENMAPLVTAIVSTYNSESYIRGCIEDLERQTIAERLEIIVIDSNSQEHEGEIVREFQKTYRNIRYVRTDQRETVYAAWNRAIGMAQGRYITNANTDDRHREDAFERMVTIMENNSDVDLVYADLLITTTPNQTFEECTPTGNFTWLEPDRNALLYRGCFIGPQPLWCRSLHDLYGYFDPEFITSGDYEFWLRISQTARFHHIAEPLGLYLASPTSIEHVNEASKGRENAAILTKFRLAAARENLIGFTPFDDLRSYVLCRPSSSNSSDQLRITLHHIEDAIPCHHQNSLGLVRVCQELWHASQETPLKEDDCELFIIRTERLILNATEWLNAGHTCATDEAVIRGILTRDSVRQAHRLAMRNETAAAVDLLLQKGIRCSPDDPTAYFELIEILISESRHQEALQVLPEMPPVTDISLKHEVEAICLCALGNDYAAEQAARLVFASEGKHPRTLVVLGTLAARRGNIQEAEVLFRQAIESDPSCAGAWLSLGMLLWGNGNQEGAWQAVKRSVILDPLNKEAVDIMRDMAERLG